PHAEPELVSRDVRKTVTVLAASVAISTTRDERLDPEALRRVMGRGFSEIRAAVELHGGSVETSSGEAVTAVFGIPTGHEDDALRALRAAADMRERLASLAEELEGHWGALIALRIGVSTGEVVAGGEQLQPIGEPLTAAYRLAQQAEPGEIVLDEATY